MINPSQYTKSLLKKTGIPQIEPGWTIRVSQRIKEGEKTRVQAFEGIVIARKHGNETGATFTIRKVIDGVGVEKTYPIFSPTIEKIQILKKARVRRSKLYYLREKSKKEIRRKIKNLPLSIKKSSQPLPQETLNTSTKESDKIE